MSAVKYATNLTDSAPPVKNTTFLRIASSIPWMLTEAFRRAVLRLFVRLELFDEDQAAGMLTWPHSGFRVQTAVRVPEADRARRQRNGPSESTMRRR